MPKKKSQDLTSELIYYRISVELPTEWQEFQYPNQASPELSWTQWCETTAIKQHLDEHYPGWITFGVDYDFKPELRIPPAADANDFNPEELAEDEK